MNEDISQLVKQKAWEWVNLNYIPPVPDVKTLCVLESNWEFKLKRLPGTTPLKYKACYNVCGDLQKAGVD